MKRHILYIIVAIFALTCTTFDAVAKAPRVSPVEFLRVGEVKISANSGQVDVAVRSNVRKKLTLVEGSVVVVEDGAGRVTLSEPVVVEARTEQTLPVRFGFEVNILKIAKLINKEKINVRIDAKYKIGNAKRARSFRYQMDVPMAEVKKYMKF